MNRLRRTTVLLVFLPALWPAVARAHAEPGRTLDLLSGLKHPVSGLDHVVAMVAVGIWGAQLGTPAVWALPVTFPVVMAFGGMLALARFSLPGVDIAIALSGIALGLAVLGRWRPAAWVAAVVVGAFAVFHGYAHGAELPPGSNGLLYSIGFVVATGTLHACGIAIGLLHRWNWGRIWLRVAGASVASIGAWFLVRALQ